MALPDGSMERLVEHFSTKVADLRFCLSIRGAVTEDENQTLLREIDKETGDMEKLLNELRQCVDGRSKRLEAFEVLSNIHVIFAELCTYFINKLFAIYLTRNLGFIMWA